MTATLASRRALSPYGPRQLLRRLCMAACPARCLMIRGPKASNEVCLTFDDGPDPELTPALLDVLRDLRASATFFVIGEKAKRYPEIVRRMAAEGHAVGHHSFCHTPAWTTSARQLRGEVEQSRALLAELGIVNSSLFRPPYGALTARKMWDLWRAKQTVVLWSLDPEDFRCEEAGSVATWLGDHPCQAGDIILMHDTFPHAISILPGWVADTRARGLELTRVDSWLAAH